MSEPENFLARWSRRKREAEEESERVRPSETGLDAPEPPAEPDGASSAEASPAETLQGAPAEPSGLDLASLPPIEAITADTDIRGFLAPGVPDALKRAALRRAYSVDPNIRDFVGLAENAWDFNNPGTIPGFGALEMTPELRREVARIVGNLLPDEGAPDTDQAPASGSAPALPQPTENIRKISGDRAPAAVRAARNTEPEIEDRSQPPNELRSEQNIVHRMQSDIAAQQRKQFQENLQSPARRGHGSALPK